MVAPSRRGITLFQLLVVLAILVILFALLLPAIGQMRVQAARMQSMNNLKQIGISAHAYHDVNGFFPPGVDDNNFSALAHLLPYLEQDNLYKQIDFKKSIDDKANAPVRAARIKTFLNPMDPVQSVTMDYGATNYLFCAGSKYSLDKNNGMFFKNSKITFANITDGTSNTIMAGETLKGDSNVRAMTVQRQHVLLKKEALETLKPESGVDDFKNDRNIAADRCSSWMDGRFLQGTFTATRTLNDDKPDVSCGGIGGLSGLRGMDSVPIVLVDGSTRMVTKDVSLETWKVAAGRDDGMATPQDFFK